MMLRPFVLSLVLLSLAACEGAPSWDRANPDATQAGDVPPTTAAVPQDSAGQAPETPEMALADFLAAENIAETPVHRDAHVDLNGDGRDELLMYLEDRNWCGSGGCTLLLFHRNEGGYRLLSRVNQVQPPIAVSAKAQGGWHDLLVGVGGGGTVAGTVALQFNGSGYPDNPTLLALLAPEALPSAQVVIE